MNINKFVFAKLDFHQDEKIKQESGLFFDESIYWNGSQVRVGVLLSFTCT